MNGPAKDERMMAVLDTAEKTGFPKAEVADGSNQST